MKKRRWNNILLTLILAAVTVLLPVTAMAAGNEFTTESGFNCNVLTDDTVMISGYAYEKGEDLIIPEEVYQGNLRYTVTVIGQYAFQDKKFNGNLTLPETLICIKNNAFSNCRGLTGDLTIPDSVEYIGEGAFYDCTGFEGELKLGSGLKEIGAGAFHGCMFTGRLEIPSSVSYIGNAAFFNCSGFTGDLSLTGNNMKIGGNDSVEDADCFDRGVFYKCNGLSGTLTIGEGVTYIDGRAFDQLPNITRVINNSDQEIDLSMLSTGRTDIEDKDSPWTDKATGKKITRIGKGIAVQDKPIESVEVSVTAPSAGTVITATEDPAYISGYDPDTQDPYPEASIPDGVPYRLMGESLLYGYWYDDVLTDPFDSSNISFYVNDETHPEVEPGEELLAGIRLEPTSGYYFPDEIEVTAKGGTLVGSEVNDYGAMTVYILVTVEDVPVEDIPVESVEVSVTAPSAGTVITATEDPTYISGYDPDTQDPYPEASIPDDVPYRLMGDYSLYGYWYDDVLPDPFDGRNISFYVNDETHPEVESGEKLLAEIWLEPKSGYYFTDETKVTAKGGTLIASELHDGIMAVYILVTVNEVPDTGVPGYASLWIVLAAVSVCGLAFLRKKKSVI